MLSKVLNFFLKNGVKNYDTENVASYLGVNVIDILKFYPNYKTLVKACLELHIRNLIKVKINNQKSYYDVIECLYYEMQLIEKLPSSEIFFREVKELYPIVFVNKIEYFYNQLNIISSYINQNALEQGYFNPDLNLKIMDYLYANIFFNLDVNQNLTSFKEYERKEKEFNIIFLLGICNNFGQSKLLKLLL